MPGPSSTTNTYLFFRFFACFIWTLFLFFSKNIGSQIPDIRFEHLTVDDGLSQSAILCVNQDSLGFIWFGTIEGLNRYDGQEFTIFRHNSNDPGSISSNDIMALANGRGNVLWVGHDKGTLDRFDLSTEQFDHFIFYPGDSLDANLTRIVSILEDRRGKVWYSMLNTGLILLDPVSGQTQHFFHDPDDPSSISSNFIYHIFEDTEGSIWLSTNRGLNRVDPNSQQNGMKFQHYDLPPGNPNPSLSSNIFGGGFESQSGKLWLNTMSGIASFNTMTNEFESISCPVTSANWLFNNLTMDAQGYLWSTTGDLIRIDPVTRNFKLFKHDPADPSSLSAKFALTHINDREGNLWVGTLMGGINKYHPLKDKFLHYRHNPQKTNSLSANIVSAQNVVVFSYKLS